MSGNCLYSTLMGLNQMLSYKHHRKQWAVGKIVLKNNFKTMLECTLSNLVS